MWAPEVSIWILTVMILELGVILAQVMAFFWALRLFFKGQIANAFFYLACAFYFMLMVKL